MKYTLLEKQQEFFNIPHDHQLDVVIYQGGYGSGKTWCGSLLGIMLARKYPGSRGLVCAKEYVLVRLWDATMSGDARGKDIFPLLSLNATKVTTSQNSSISCVRVKVFLG